MAGILNAAVWFGAVVFVTFGLGPATTSKEMRVLLGANNYPFFSGAIGLVMVQYLVYLQLVCGCLALLHMVAGWLYSGKVPSRSWRGLLLGLVLLSILSGTWWQPKMRQLHVTRYAPNVSAERQARANRSFSTWQTMTCVANLMSVVGLAVYVWRVANPPDPTRFVSSVKFRS